MADADPTEPSRERAESADGSRRLSDTSENFGGETIHRLTSVVTLWRYVGLLGAPEDAARASLNEHNRTLLTREMQRIPMACDYNLRESSCFVLKAGSSIRYRAIRIVDSQPFENAVLATIGLNTVVMALQRDDLVFLDLVFLSLFVIEMLLKVCARGFVLHRGAYLRSGWNVMDCVIVFAGIATIVLEEAGSDGANLTPLRLLRVIRPLRAVSRVQGLKVIMETIAKAAGTLKDVLLLTGFFLVVFAVIGVQLWNGEQHNRCFANLSTEAAVLAPIASDTECCDKLAGGRSANTSLARQFCEADVGQYGGVVESSLPTNESYYFCSAAAIAVAEGAVNRTGNSMHLLRNVSSGCSKGASIGTACDVDSTGLHHLPVTCHRDHDQFEKDILNFDNIFSALLLCFKVMSLDDWPVDMKEIQDVSGMSAAFFFVSLTLFGNYFTVNLVLAVLSTVFGEEKVNCECHKDARDTTPIMSLRPSTAVGGTVVLHALMIVDPGSVNPRGAEEVITDEFAMDSDDGDDALSGAGSEPMSPEGNNTDSPAHKDRLKKKARQQSRWYKLVQSKSFRWFMTGATLVNILAMAVDHYGIEPTLDTVLQFINLGCSAVFLVEMVLKLKGLGLAEYFDSPFNTFDCLLVIVSVVEFSLHLSQGQFGGGSSVSALRAFRAFRLAGAVKTLRLLLATMVRSVKSVLYVGVLLFIFVFIFALFGITLFASGSSDGTFEGSRASFANVAQACITVFVVTTGEGWATVMVAIMRKADNSRWAVAVYFVSCFVIGNYLLSNLFVAILIDSFSQNNTVDGPPDDVDLRLDKATPITEALGVSLDGCCITAVDGRGAAGQAGVGKDWVVSCVNGAEVVTSQDILDAVDRSDESTCTLTFSPAVPGVRVRGARAGGEDVWKLNGDYRQVGEADGQPWFLKTHRALICGVPREEPCVIKFDPEAAAWVATGPGFRVFSNCTHDNLCGRWPDGIKLEWTDQDDGEPFTLMRPMAKRIFIYDNVVTRLSANCYITVDYKPYHTIGDVKLQLQQKMLPLRNVPPEVQHLWVACAAGSDELADDVTLRSLFAAPFCERPPGAHRLQPALPGEREPPPEECLLLSYELPRARHCGLKCFRRSMSLSCNDPFDGDPVAQNRDMIRSIARRLLVSEDRIRVVDEAGVDTDVNYLTLGKGVGTLTAHVLPVPILPGERCTLRLPGVGSSADGYECPVVDAVVVGGNLLRCPRDFALKRLPVSVLMKQRRSESVTCSVSGLPIQRGSNVWVPDCDDPGYTFDVSEGVMEYFVTVKVKGERMVSVRRDWWDYQADVTYSSGVRMVFAGGVDHYDVDPKLPASTVVTAGALPPGWDSPVIEHPFAALPPLLREGTVWQEQGRRTTGAIPEFFRRPSLHSQDTEQARLMPRDEVVEVTQSMGREIHEKGDCAPQDVSSISIRLRKRDSNPFRDALFRTDSKRRLKDRAEKRASRTMLSGSAFGFLKADSSFRVRLASIEQHEAFDGCVLFLIALNTIFIAMDAPSVSRDKPTLASILQISDYVFTSLFCLEVVIRCAVHGVWRGEGAFLNSKWHRFDLFIAVISVVGVAFEAVKPARALRAVRLLLRLPGIGEQQRRALSALRKSLLLLSNVCIMCALFGTVFAILGVALYKGALGRCTDPAVDRKSLCVGTANQSSAGALGPEYSVVPREWVWEDFGFNNVLDALRTLVWVALGERWASIMFRTLDSQGEDLGPEQNGSPAAAVYFVVFVFVGQFFMLNLFIGVLIDGYQREKDEMAGSNLLTEPQQEFLTYEKLILRGDLSRRRREPHGCGGMRQLCYVIVNTENGSGESYFDTLVTLLILLNTVTLMTLHADQSESWTNAQSVLDWCFILLFTLEMAIKIMAASIATYVADPWNRFDLFVVVVSWLGKLLDNTVLKTMRIARFMRLINISRGLQVVFLTLVHSLGQLFNVALLLITLIFMFAVFGVQLCGSVKHTDQMHQYLNFDNVGNAILTLYVIATTEGWLDVSEGCKIREPVCDESAGNCGAPNAMVELFFTVYMFVIAVIIINLFITVLLENFNEIGKEEELQKCIAPLLGSNAGSFKEMWLDHDTEATGFLPCDKFFSILKRMPYPYWGKALFWGREDLTSLVQLRRLAVPVLKGRQVRWADCSTALAMALAGVTTNDGFSCSRAVLGLEEYRARRHYYVGVHHWYAVNIVQKHWVRYKKTEMTRLIWHRALLLSTQLSELLVEQSRAGAKRGLLGSLPFGAAPRAAAALDSRSDKDEPAASSVTNSDPLTCLGSSIFTDPSDP
eukprot:TRINITY_DN3159_c0_g1_i1.p1 TRINITY_DN3159_c0_g1~~TRINITY_DN3159_c0_g1_i1.p1  ORF type:complete len:2278 (+),score=722.49 TRINITY_DN3159_c0_g1_i1:70-6903(+)